MAIAIYPFIFGAALIFPSFRVCQYTYRLW